MNRIIRIIGVFLVFCTIGTGALSAATATATMPV